MRTSKYLILIIAGAIAGCSQSPDDTIGSSSENAGSESAAVVPATAGTAREENSPLADLAALEVSVPRLAYVYRFAFRTSGEDVAELQRRHVDLCERQGPANCRVLGMRTTGEHPNEITGELQLAVASRSARAFGTLLEDDAERTGVQQISSEIATEDLSKAMVDTEAQLRARTELRDRLMEVLRTRTGSVEELVAAERSVAQVNQEIDQARSWLAEMRDRVAFSRVDVRYESGARVANDFLSPIRSTVASLDSILGFAVAALIVFLAAIGPVAGLVWLGRRLRAGGYTGDAA